MNTERLLKLADLLEADANNEKGVSFDLTAWARKRVGSTGEFSNCSFDIGEVVPVDCSTAACAWGLAAISGKFAADGVGYRVSIIGVLTPTFDGKTDYEAAETFFEIGYRQTAFLFDPEYYPETKLKGRDGELFVAQRIRDLAAGQVTEAEIDEAEVA
jgi:hypothetical protein